MGILAQGRAQDNDTYVFNDSGGAQHYRAFKSQPGSSAGVNPTHYGSPLSGCKSDEIPIWTCDGTAAWCSPMCSTQKCPTDVPMGTSAKPDCYLRGLVGKMCALLCDVKNATHDHCGQGQVCIKGASDVIGICAFPAPCH